ncbi:MAG: hypothetical protein IJU30_03790 [Lachnospiraceae bacterium]|nr:hypothetical protein [Lachnospiraceae bacterium]
MKDKISRLAKGMLDMEAPVITISPESVREHVSAGRLHSFVLEVLSTNGAAIKGICFSDHPAIRADIPTFTGRRVHVSMRVDATGMQAGDIMAGSITLVTNGGEYRIPYELICDEAPAAAAAETAGSADNVVEDPLVYGFGEEKTPVRYGAAGAWAAAGSAVSGAGIRTSAGSGSAGDKGTRQAAAYGGAGTDAFGTDPDEEFDREAQLRLLRTSLPEDGPLFEAVLSAMIRAKDDSLLTYSFCKEAIRRGLSLTRLYETYIHAYPDDSDEMMPREVLLYFSYDRDPEAAIREKLYKNVLLYVDRDSELYAIYETRISHFAMKSLQELRISRSLQLIYDRMIFPGMIDQKAAAVLPDLLKARRVTLIGGSAAFVSVRYPELGARMRARMINGEAYIPVYFADAKLQFEDEDGRVITGAVRVDDESADEGGRLTDSLTARADVIRYMEEEMFRRPDLLLKCFEMAPEHRMLLLSAAKEIRERGIRNEEDKAILVKALDRLQLKRSFRAGIVRQLCLSDGDPRWISVLEPGDYTPETASDICRALCAHDHYEEAWKITAGCGSWRKDPGILMDILDGMIRKGRIPTADGLQSPDAAPDPLFVALCKYVFDLGPDKAADSVVQYLAYDYEGPAVQMYRVMSEALTRGQKLYDLPEKTLTLLLFADCRDHIDETFEAYIGHCRYTDMMVRAYLNRRSADYFLDEQEVIGSILFDALFSYMKAVDDPRKLPDIMALALTKYYSEKESLTQEETQLCQTLTDKLIEDGLIFCYTKKLRKKIRVARELCDRFYVEFHGDPETAPKLLVRILPDESEFRQVEMKRVYRNIYVMSTLLFMGDEMHYLIYETPGAEQPAEEGVIKVTKYHKLKDDRYKYLNNMLKAIADKDKDMLRENMLHYVETGEVTKKLFTLS